MRYNVFVDIVKSFRYRIYPTAAQEAQLIQFAGCRRFVWNWALARKQEVYKETGKGISAYSLSAELTQLKKQPETAFLGECVRSVFTQTLMDLDKAFAAFFDKRARFPRFKSRKKCLHAMRFPESVSVEGQSVKLPKIGKVKAAIHRPAEGVLKSATVQQVAGGAWYVVFLSHVTAPDIPVTCSNPVGLDVGLETFVTLSTGEKVKPPKFARKAERKTARLQKQLSRCEKQSRRRQKAKTRLARHHSRTANRRKDWLHKLSARLVAEHDTLCIETLNVSGLVRTKLAKSFSDAALSEFLRQLEYKSKWNAGQVVKVGKFYPSSKTCHACGNVQTLTLSDRVWVCLRCGASLDRDLNAARNIEAEGLRLLNSVAAGIAETENAHGACVRLATASGGR